MLDLRESVPMDDTPDPEYVVELQKHRAALEEAKLTSARDRDRAVLTVATGALAVSVAFLERVVPVVRPWSLVVLGLSWLALIGAVVVVLVSLHTSEDAFTLEIERTNNMISQGGTVDPGWKNRSADLTCKLNWWASGLLVSGIVLWLVHAAVNLQALVRKH